MAEIIETGFEGRAHGTIVRTGEGKTARYYLVSSALTPDHGYETMVFSFSTKKKAVTDWAERYVEHYNTYSAMAYGHERVCKHLEEYLKRHVN